MCISNKHSRAWGLFVQAVAVQFLFSVPQVLYAKKWRVVCASHTCVQPFRTASPVWSEHPLTFCQSYSPYAFPSGVQFLLPPSPLFSCCWNPFVARLEVPFLCALQVSEDEESLFLYYDLLHFLHLPGCFPHGILVQPFSSFSCWKWTYWINGRVLFVIFFFTLEESLYCKNKFINSSLFFPVHQVNWTILCIFRICIFDLFYLFATCIFVGNKPHLWDISTITWHNLVKCPSFRHK